MLKRFRVISDYAINGVPKGEEFEAEWPNEWLTRRLNCKHIEEVLSEPEEDLEEDPYEDEEPDEDLVEEEA